MIADIKCWCYIIAMKVTKYFHSCLLIEDHGSDILIDPGLYVFIDNHLRPEDMPKVDVIIFTHRHGDHFDLESLQKILQTSPQAKIFCPPDLQEILSKEGIKSEILKPKQKINAAGFEIEGVKAEHGDLPRDVPDNIGVLIDGRMYHPGDNVTSTPPVKQLEILALPIIAPWNTVKQAVDWAVKLKPQNIIPIHDGYLKDFMRESQQNQRQENFTDAGITFYQMKGFKEVADF
ncbi:MAG: hypothetical protein COT81_01575 [Candidatus Buchananbacteria bacterium CG10_big_fil_rev_8_21_14_0_10_42_9]|uniref:Metallo-beta-lactamase domain-containing protein n=1 Tax=Candidatus Buchananbacteria bacterium CG10_big_fil_rev_8_21_14_0_10_42_9 TaxID=1974526 RepID=A0A2H0W1X3_9BACT|nr:MAG: hypothetical protein COT81_01575 [Candidatus Buchananbacteria bacterium CG10_big_fil_rev_8_21_14_0_10_42_9]